ncbi:hypothetical protein [Lentiprolixibacter aurantiacus]|uniref:Uncharacterized protein n=1 Tax=Lentiprolixibacter aurantiacus TaxID=2993939 RepID=A0AAE3SNQ5_9FLAO|nr:hypothetical protein [Lentiprolixibacter aurantiacus]MCX2719431.1 hypothetical protein [Lentiprolixibacter aurantiacus]
MLKRLINTFLVSLIFFSTGIAQEPQLFSRKDFDLRGPVKNCLVITSYGQEEFEFNPQGLLTKSITRFSEKDYSITYYKYQDSLLLEQRNENYMQGQLDETTSIAHFYTRDTTSNRITERIYSYQKEFLDQYEYIYNEENRLIRIIRSNEEGVDETEITYIAENDENTVTYTINGVIQKSIKTTVKNKETPEEQELVLTREYLGGVPNRAIEVVRDNEGFIRSSKEFFFDAEKEEFKLRQRKDFEYDAEGNPSKETILLGRAKSSKAYIHQLDGSEFRNWIKQIVTPDNTYKTRRITYFESEEKTKER